MIIVVLVFRVRGQRFGEIFQKIKILKIFKQKGGRADTKIQYFDIEKNYISIKSFCFVTTSHLIISQTVTDL